MVNLIGYLLFAFITSITPGPNNLLLLSYGKQYGLKGTIGVMAGIFTGFFALSYLAGYGIGQIINSNAIVAISFKIVSSVWLLYLAYIVSRIQFNDSENKTAINFPKAFLMQFVNPKAWLMAINGAAVFMPTYSSIHINVFVFAIIFGAVGIPCMITWVMLGDIISRFWKSENSNTIIGYSLAVLMLVSIVSVWM
jgi:threonine/homoserine/homoserine lactone efflux protein